MPRPTTNPRNPLRRRLGRNALIYAVIALGAIWLVGSVVGHGKEPQKLRFDQFMAKVEDGDVRTAEMFLRDQRITGTLDSGTKYQTTYAGDGDTLSGQLVKEHV